AVPYTNVIAPNELVAGSQLVEKIPLKPSWENHDVDCCVVVMAIRTRITSTSRPAASARICKTRSPSGRRCASGWADPATSAGSALTAALTTGSPSELAALVDPPLTR